MAFNESNKINFNNFSDAYKHIFKSDYYQISHYCRLSSTFEKYIYYKKIRYKIANERFKYWKKYTEREYASPCTGNTFTSSNSSL